MKWRAQHAYFSIGKVDQEGEPNIDDNGEERAYFGPAKLTLTMHCTEALHLASDLMRALDSKEEYIQCKLGDGELDVPLPVRKRLRS